MKRLLFKFFALGIFVAGVGRAQGQGLMISEVLVDGTDEFIEIVNLGASTFHGSFSISGAKKSLLDFDDIELDPGEILLLGDKFDMLPSDYSGKLISGLSLDLADTKQLYLSLQSDETSSDEFVVSLEDVKNYDNKKTSFQRLWNGLGWLILPTTAAMVTHTKEPYLINPSVLYQQVAGEITLRTGWGDDTPPGGEEESEHNGDEVDQRAPDDDNNTHEENSGNSISCTSLPFFVEELYNGDQYPHYIELVFLQDYEGSVLLSGTTLGSGILSGPTPREKNKHYLITSTTSGRAQSTDILVLPSFALDTGLVALSTETGSGWYELTLDQSGFARYPQTRDCASPLQAAGASPGFDHHFLAYLGKNQDLVCPGAPSNTETSSGGQEDVPSPGDGVGGETGGSTTQTTDYLKLGFTIVGVDYSGPSTADQDITIRYDTGDIRIDLSALRMRVNGVNKTIEGFIDPGGSLTLTKKFGMLKTKPSCIELVKVSDKNYPDDIIYDKYCYDPHGDDPGQTTNEVDYASLKLHIVSIDYNVHEANQQRLTIRYDSGPPMLDLSKLRARVNGSNKLISGVIHLGSEFTIVKNFGFLKTKQTCVELVYQDTLYDKYCTTPSTSAELTEPDLTLDDYSERSIRIESLDYDPPGSDKNSEHITLRLLSGEDIDDLSSFYLYRGKTKHYLTGSLRLGVTTSITGDFQMPNSKPTCVELRYRDQLFDSSCYDPQQTKVSLSGERSLGTDRSSLQLAWILPNPLGKDEINTNEYFALARSGQSGQVMDKGLKLKVGSSTINLSGLILQSGQTAFVSSKTLPNTPNCAKLYHGDQLLDQFCYPQAKEGVRYFHPRLHQGPATIPQSLLDALDFKQGALSKLLLVKTPDKKTCLSYEGVHIRCVAASETATSKKNRALLTLDNAYIARIHDLYYAHRLTTSSLQDYLSSYRYLSQKIKSNELDHFSLFGAQIKPTELDRYHEMVRQQSSSDYVLDQLGHALFGQQSMEDYYSSVYS